MSDVVIKLIADAAVVPVALLGAWALLFTMPSGTRFQAYARVVMAGLTALLVAKLISSIYQPEMERPFEVLGLHAGASYLNNPGFPSDHTLFCMAITLAVWFETRIKKLSLLLLGLTVVVAVGRVLALVHTPLDVIGGIVIACAGIPWYLQRDNVKLHAVTLSRQKYKKRV